MIRMPDYEILEVIAKSKDTTIMRALRKADETHVVIKVLNYEYPSARELSDFVREYEIMKALKGSGIIRPYELLKVSNSLAIVMEDIDGDSVAKMLKLKKYTLEEKLSLAILMTDALSQLHKQSIIHKDINPTNFLWNPRTNQVRIIDFGISAELPREASQSVNLGIIEGTLSYISPEQTGRINRPIDYRTDLYSLGVTLYEMFTGRLPFAGNEGIDLIYCHIAKMPPVPRRINMKIGTALSEIIMKLLSKTAEERYQSAYGLKQDLEYCLRSLGSPKRQGAVFIPGQSDINDRFEIPNTLYGREKDIETLIDGFARAADGGMETLLVSGYSGIGKTSLIHEIRKPITLKKGYFASGNYTQFDMNVPYSGISQAFNELMRQLLIEPQESLENWKKQLTEALGTSGQVIIDIIPELERIIGPQLQPAELNPLEAQNRFQITFCEFLRVLAGKEHPIAIFLDDLQWCDASSLDLIKYIITSGSMKYVLLVGAYRDNEVNPGHPLSRMLDDLRATYTGCADPFGEIVLKPLDFTTLNRLISDTLHTKSNVAEPLTKIVLQKTKGNPFFIKRMLSVLYNRGIITYVADKAKWTYDLSKVKKAEISENVVELLVKNLETLPADTMEDLMLASCIGIQFNLKTLSRIKKKPVAELGRELWIAIENGIIIPLSNSYRLIKTLSSNDSYSDVEFRFAFSHDHLRQVFYSTISEEKKCEMHLLIARELLKSYSDTGQSETIFELVGHFNMCRNLLKEKTERFELMELNVQAGRRAKNSTAFAAALGYFEIAEAVLTVEEWKDNPDLMFKLLLELAGTALLSGDIAKSDDLCERMKKLAKTKLEICAVSNIKILIYLFKGQLIDTIKEGREALALLGITLPEDAAQIARMDREGIDRMKSYLAENSVEELVNLPVMNDPEKLMAMQLLFQLAPPAIQADMSLYNLTILTMFDLTVTYGTSPLACKCFGDCGVIFGTELSDYTTGYRLGLAAFELINKFKAESQRPPVYFIFTYLSYWRAHVQESLTYYEMSYRSGLETGDLMHATFAIAHKLLLMFWAGKSLSECKTELAGAAAFLNSAKGVMPLLLTEIVSYTIERLSTQPVQGDKQLFEEKERALIEAIEKSHNMAFLCRLYCCNSFVSFILSDLDAAEKWNRLADGIIYAALSDFPISDHYLIKGLILIKRYPNASEAGKKKILKSLSDIKQKLAYWAENCHENFDHKYFLLMAELGILEDSPLESIVAYFKKALQNAESGGFTHMKALIGELYADFWLNRGEETIGKAYAREAYYSYRQWGALRKIASLEKRFEKFFISTEGTIQNNASNFTTTVNSIDKYSILKSAQAISSEIKIEKLMTKLINTMIENAGAQRGCMLLRNEADGQFYIEAVQNVSKSYLKVMHSSLFTESKELCVEVVQYVARTREALVINDALSSPKWQMNPYITEKHIKSVLCLPVFYQNRIKGILYLENNLSDNVFTVERLETLKILSSQAAISIENARLYENMEEKVKERTIQLKDANEKLRELSIRDHLTGLHNRRYVFDFAYDRIMKQVQKKKMPSESAELEQSDSDKKVFGVVLLDIDLFKSVNDTYGHAAGDGVLKTISKLLKKHVKSGELVARWGGEEFLLVLCDRKPDEIVKYSRRLLKSIRETPMEVGEGIMIFQTCSLGCVEMPLDEENPTLLNLEQMINLSDYALYCAKEKGRDCAARFKLKKSLGQDEGLKTELINFSKNSVLNTEYFDIEYI